MNTDGFIATLTAMQIQGQDMTLRTATLSTECARYRIIINGSQTLNGNNYASVPMPRYHASALKSSRCDCKHELPKTIDANIGRTNYDNNGLPLYKR
jgi:hypothetical protein